MAKKRRRPNYTVKVLDKRGNIRALARLEAEIIEWSLAHHNYEKSKTSKALHISRQKLYRHMRKIQRLNKKIHPRPA